MSKIDCSRGAQGHPLFRFLTDSISSSNWMTTVFGKGLKWNFTKFLCDENGIPIRRYESGTEPLDIEADILELLNKS